MRLLREAAKTRKETSKAKVQHQVQHKTRQDKTRDKTTPNRNRPQLTTQPTRDKQTKINGCKVFEETDALNGQGLPPPPPRLLSLFLFCLPHNTISPLSNTFVYYISNWSNFCVFCLFLVGLLFFFLLVVFFFFLHLFFSFPFSFFYPCFMIVCGRSS